MSRLSEKNERILVSKDDKTFLGTPTGSINFNQMKGVFYAFLIILLIAMIFVGVIIYRKRIEWKERQKRRGSNLLRRYTVQMDR